MASWHLPVCSFLVIPSTARADDENCRLFQYSCQYSESIMPRGDTNAKLIAPVLKGTGTVWHQVSQQKNPVKAGGMQ
jgi:hypothetical protein